MSGKWFTNRGQIAQLVITAIGVSLTIYVTLPRLPIQQGWDGFVSVSPVFVFPSVVLVVFYLSLQRLSKKIDGILEKPAEAMPVSPQVANQPKAVASAFNKPRMSDPTWQLDGIAVETIRVRVGSYWEVRLGGMSSLRLSPLTIIGEPDARKADVGFKYGGIVFHCGQHVETLAVNRFLIPISHSGFQSEERFVYEFSCSADHIQFLAIRVHGIDSHNQEIEFEIARLRTFFRLPQSKFAITWC